MVTPYLVKPVNDSDIVLPTDGFRAAPEFQRTFGYRDNAGVSGEKRPGPTAVDKDAPPPAVSAMTPSDALPPAENDPSKRAEKNSKNRKSDRRADASAAPGFSLK